MINKNLEFELAKNTVFSIIKGEDKEEIDRKYQDYLSYIQENCTGFNKKLLEYVDTKYTQNEK